MERIDLRVRACVCIISLSVCVNVIYLLLFIYHYSVAGHANSLSEVTYKIRHSILIALVQTEVVCKLNVLKEGIILFNDALNTFYLRLYGVRHGKGPFR